MGVFHFKRIVVVGTTSSGKSTLAMRLAGKIHGDFIELDAFHWEPNWVEAPLDVFRERVERAVQADAWAVAGNYHTVRDIIWPKAQVVIWLDYPFRVVFGRLLSRTIRRSLFQEELWNGNRENFMIQLRLWSEDSLFHWLFKTYWRRKREIPQLMNMQEHSHLELIRFTHPRDTRHWLDHLIVS